MTAINETSRSTTAGRRTSGHPRPQLPILREPIKNSSNILRSCRNGVAIVGGDPLCDTANIARTAIRIHRIPQKTPLGHGIHGCERRPFTESTPNEKAKTKQTNSVPDASSTHRTMRSSLEWGAKHITTQNRQLLNKAKGNNTPSALRTCRPWHSPTTPIRPHSRLRCMARRAKQLPKTHKAFMIFYEPLALPVLMAFVYTRHADGHVNGFAALRHLGSEGTTSIPASRLQAAQREWAICSLVAAMALLNRAPCVLSRIRFFEPLHALTRDDVSGIPGPFAHLARDLYGHAFQRLPIEAEFRGMINSSQTPLRRIRNLILFFLLGSLVHGICLAMTHMANIPSWRKIFWADVRGWAHRGEKTAALEGAQDQQSQNQTKDHDLDWTQEPGSNLEGWNGEIDGVG